MTPSVLFLEEVDDVFTGSCASLVLIGKLTFFVLVAALDAPCFDISGVFRNISFRYSRRISLATLFEFLDH